MARIFAICCLGRRPAAQPHGLECVLVRMTRAGTAALTVLAAAVFAAPARASFAPPVELATARYVVNAAAATDAAGTTTVVATGTTSGTLLFEHPRGAAWSPGMRLPGRPHGVAGPVVDARGEGALGIAWRVDQPRKYTGIAVAIRDPGGILSEPIAVAGTGAGGVRHPALAIDRAGDALVAYNSATAKVHLNLQGAISVAHRSAGASFSTPTVVDRAVSSPPAVALGSDGSGIVAWTHDRRVYVVSVAPDGSIGKVKSFASPTGVRSLVAAAGAGGAATVAWTSHRSVASRTPRTRYYVRALSRAAGRAFGAVQDVATTTEFIGKIRIAADEAGRATLAWTEDHYGRPPSRGARRITSAVRSATATVGSPFARAQEVAARRTRSFGPPAVAAAGGRAALAWGLSASRTDLAVQAAIGPAGDLGAAQSVVAKRLAPGYYRSPPAIAVALDPNGTATVLYEEPVDGPNGPVMTRLMAAEGS
jgi:hypothetical protein